MKRARTWTSEQIRRAVLLPKPTGAERRITDPRSLIRDLDPPDRRALRAIAENADLIDARGTDAMGRGVVFLLVGVPMWVLNILAEFEAERGDDLGAYDEREEEPDGEPDLGAPERVSQLLWAKDGRDFEADDCDSADDSEY